MKSARLNRDSQNRIDFLQTPHSNRNRIKEKEKLSEDIKAKYIQDLQQRNRKLKYEIIKINEMLEEHKQKGTGSKKDHKLVPLDSSADVLKKELDNVYKQIKNYQRQISSLENKQAGGMISDRMARFQNILKEKTAHLEKLKNQFSVLSKNSFDNSRKLKNNAGKQELENAMVKYNDDLKVLRQKVRNAEQKQKRKMENAKKQYDYIKKLERQLVQNGVSMDELQEMKKNNIFNQIYEKLNSDQKQSPQKQGKRQSKKTEAVEDTSVERFNQIKNQIKLYKKLHQDYDKRIDVLEKQKGQQEKKVGEAKKILEERQTEIKKLQDQINQMKTKMRKNNNKQGANETAKVSRKESVKGSLKGNTKESPNKSVSGVVKEFSKRQQ